jgi:bacteriocin-like protein
MTVNFGKIIKIIISLNNSNDCEWRCTMELVGELKEKVEKAESKEEARDTIREAGIELTEEEMEQVVGGLDSAFDKAGHKYFV